MHPGAGCGFQLIFSEGERSLPLEKVEDSRFGGGMLREFLTSREGEEYYPDAFILKKGAAEDAIRGDFGQQFVQVGNKMIGGHG